MEMMGGLSLAQKPLSGGGEGNAAVGYLTPKKTGESKVVREINNA